MYILYIPIYIDLAENKEYMKKNIKYYVYFNGIK